MIRMFETNNLNLIPGPWSFLFSTVFKEMKTPDTKKIQKKSVSTKKVKSKEFKHMILDI